MLAVRALAQEKHLELALDALAHVRDVRLAIVGDGPARAALEARANALGVSDRVRFTGALQPAALPDIYASSDAFVFPSATETQGLVLAEALACGLPVVAVDVAGEPRSAGRLRTPGAPRSGPRRGRARGGAGGAARPRGGRVGAPDASAGPVRAAAVLDLYADFRVPYIWHSGARLCSRKPQPTIDSNVCSIYNGPGSKQP